jgi:protein-L-isoaspartate(D-aspartate) O-methyltransferase
MSLQQPSPPQTEQDARNAQNKAAFLMDLRARGIQDLNLLWALEIVPREIFVPHRFSDLAGRPIACRCVAARPFLNPGWPPG